VNDLTLIRKNLFRRKLRAILMMVSILIAFAIFGVLASFERAFNAGQDRATPDRLVVTNKISFTQPLPISYFNRVAAIDGVAQINHFSWFGGYYQEPRNFLVAFAVDPENWMKLRDSDFVFSPEARAAFIRERTGVLVGARMMEKWGWKVGDHIPISSNIWSQKNRSHAWDFIIVGSFTARIPQADTNVMLMGYDYFNETRSFGKDLISWMSLRTTSVAANERVSNAIDGMFANSPYETTTDSEKAFNKAFAAQLGNPDDRRQHHGDDGARAHARDRRAEDAGLFRWPHPAHGARRIDPVGAARRPARPRRRASSDHESARQPDELRSDAVAIPRHRGGGGRTDGRVRDHHGSGAGAQRDAPQYRHRAGTELIRCARFSCRSWPSRPST
jgi:hypothetical protein